MTTPKQIARGSASSATGDSVPFRLPLAARIAYLSVGPMIDVHVVDHCNLRCAGCIHFAPLAKPSFLNLEEYERDLAALASIPHIAKYLHRLCLMGGEPLLHPKLPEVIRLSRAYLPTTDMALDSNGLLLGRVGADFWAAMAECPIELTLSPYPLRINYPRFWTLPPNRASRHICQATLRASTKTRTFSFAWL